MTRQKPVQFAVKRSIDVAVSASLLVLLAPVLGLIALLVRIGIGSPVLFTQERVGYRNKPFYILKFRTMTNDTDAEGRLLPDHERRHGVGRWIRSWSLDELPQLWNVLKGEMSLVGPRPLIEQDLHYAAFDRHLRHAVRPGVTGLAQVSGRNDVPWPAKLALDNIYAGSWTLWMDAKILLKTLPIVIRREGIDRPEDLMEAMDFSAPAALDMLRKTGT